MNPNDYNRFIYKCHQCLVGFKRRGMLVNHLAKRHPDVAPESVPELNLPILRQTRDYYCQYCDKVASQNKFPFQNRNKIFLFCHILCFLRSTKVAASVKRISWKIILVQLCRLVTAKRSPNFQDCQTQVSARQWVASRLVPRVASGAINSTLAR